MDHTIVDNQHYLSTFNALKNKQKQGESEFEHESITRVTPPLTIQISIYLNSLITKDDVMMMRHMRNSITQAYSALHGRLSDADKVESAIQKYQPNIKMRKKNSAFSKPKTAEASVEGAVEKLTEDRDGTTSEKPTAKVVKPTVPSRIVIVKPGTMRPKPAPVEEERPRPKPKVVISRIATSNIRRPASATVAKSEEIKENAKSAIISAKETLLKTCKFSTPPLPVPRHFDFNFKLTPTHDFPAPSKRPGTAPATSTKSHTVIGDSSNKIGVKSISSGALGVKGAKREPIVKTGIASKGKKLLVKATSDAKKDATGPEASAIPTDPAPSVPTIAAAGSAITSPPSLPAATQSDGDIAAIGMSLLSVSLSSDAAVTTGTPTAPPTSAETGTGATPSVDEADLETY